MLLESALASHYVLNSTITTETSAPKLLFDFNDAPEEITLDMIQAGVLGQLGLFDPAPSAVEVISEKHSFTLVTHYPPGSSMESRRSRAWELPDALAHDLAAVHREPGLLEELANNRVLQDLAHRARFLRSAQDALVLIHLARFLKDFPRLTSLTYALLTRVDFDSLTVCLKPALDLPTDQLEILTVLVTGAEELDVTAYIELFEVSQRL